MFSMEVDNAWTDYALSTLKNLKKALTECGECYLDNKSDILY
jgi:hypothetical protein